MSLTIRPARAADGDALWAMLEPVFRAGETYTVDPGIGRGDALSLWTGADRIVFVAEAEAGSGLAGSYYLKPNAAGPGDHVCNAGFVTAAAMQGRGVARAMLAHALDTARRAGYRGMQFNHVVATNTRAVDLWTRAGFDVVGRLPGAFRHPRAGHVDALVMFRDLTEDGDGR